MENKLRHLREELRRTGGILIAFSGGVDSTFLAAVATQELGGKVLAVTAMSPIRSHHECAEAVAVACTLGIRHMTVRLNELAIPEFTENPPQRCYHCKKELFRILRRIAEQEGLPVVADGSNADDLHDYRPGRLAAEEAGIRSPLVEAGLTKEEIRCLSRIIGLPTAEKPAFACLASRFPYGVRITEERLRAVDAVESCLREIGLTQYRARYHGDIVRIEVEERDFVKIVAEAPRRRVCESAHKAGFRYVALDLEGYRSGSLNEGQTEDSSMK